ncbi:hypothetical protein [Candidatus Palauibacter sp.]
MTTPASLLKYPGVGRRSVQTVARGMLRSGSCAKSAHIAARWVTVID